MQSVGFLPVGLLLILMMPSLAQAVDTDQDGIDDLMDNCTYRRNGAQEDADADGFGDLCDADADGDGMIDRPPGIQVATQIPNTTRIELQWARGSGATGAVVPNVVSYSVERSDDGGPFVSIHSGDYHLMTFVDDPGLGGSYAYRVRVTTSDGLEAVSETSTLTLAYPLFPLDEALDGQVRLSWTRDWPSPKGNYVLAGYQVEKFQTAWFAAHPGILTDTTFVDNDGFPSVADDTQIGINRYRVRAVFENKGGKQGFSEWSNEEQIDIQPLCDGQVVDHQIPPLRVVVADDRNGDLVYDGHDIADALNECGSIRYERLDGFGDGDGICESGENCIQGGCILRSLPETYDDVAIMLTNNLAYCDGVGDVSEPTHCLDIPLEAGLVVEGYGKESVWRSPLWLASGKPSPVFELHRRDFQFSMRNIVFDGRKFEQVEPENGICTGNWDHIGLRQWSQYLYTEISGDSLGDDDGICENEVCSEDFWGSSDQDGVCEAGEDCIEIRGDGNGICEKFWTNASPCEATITSNNGCLHNFEARRFLKHGINLGSSHDWIVEQSDFHDAGCVNNGYGMDCPYLEAVPEGTTSAWQCPGSGIVVELFTSNFKIRDNDVSRTSKYGIQMSGARTSCLGLPSGHEVANNRLTELGWMGIFWTGMTGGRVHGNTIEDTSIWDFPPSQGAVFDSFGMSLNGICNDDNEFYENTLTDMAASAISSNMGNDLTRCGPGGCTQAPGVNRIRDNWITGTCKEKPGRNWPFGVVNLHRYTSAPTFISDNVAIDNECKFALSAVLNAMPDDVGTTQAVIEGGYYESGPNGVSSSENGFYCGAVSVWGRGRQVTIRDDVVITNTGDPGVNKSCTRLGATLIVDDVPVQAFGAAGTFSPFNAPDATVVECSKHQNHPECL